MKGFSSKHSTESRCYSSGKCNVCRCVCASFSPEILQAGTVKGLKAQCVILEGIIKSKDCFSLLKGQTCDSCRCHQTTRWFFTFKGHRSDSWGNHKAKRLFLKAQDVIMKISVGHELLEIATNESSQNTLIIPHKASSINY